jgi:chromosome segregation ATPase
MLFRQVEAWQQLDESKAATIADMRAELDSARTTIARMEEQIAELRAQVVEVPGWRERVQLAELERDMWQRYAATLEDMLRIAGVALPSRPPLRGEGG